MSKRLLICTDLDRTLLPNGSQPESSGARELFRRVTSDPSVSLAYVSGRHQQLVLDAICEYAIPWPDWVIADVGSTIYRVIQGDWQYWVAWERIIESDWNGAQSKDIRLLLDDLQELSIQEPEKQNPYKLSYYTSMTIDISPLRAEIHSRLEQNKLKSSIIYSVDEAASLGLLDILPLHANKLDAIKYVMSTNGFMNSNTVFAGDSGNDLLVLTSEIPSVLVANAHQDVIQEAFAVSSEQATLDSLYHAKGSFKGMNGNYSAGILEGLHHYHPDMNLSNG